MLNDFMLVIFDCLDPEVCGWKVWPLLCIDHMFPHSILKRGLTLTLVAFTGIFHCHIGLVGSDQAGWTPRRGLCGWKVLPPCSLSEDGESEPSDKLRYMYMCVLSLWPWVREFGEDGRWSYIPPNPLVKLWNAFWYYWLAWSSDATKERQIVLSNTVESGAQTFIRKKKEAW